MEGEGTAPFDLTVPIVSYFTIFVKLILMFLSYFYLFIIRLLNIRFIKLPLLIEPPIIQT